jgi:hypothetical protein
MQISRIAVSVGTALLLAASAGIASAATIQASFFTPLAGPGPVVLDLTAITAPSSGFISGSGYTVSFAVAAGQGVVIGAVPLLHAVPVAGVTGGAPEYLTGGFGSALTTDVDSSGNYFSTGTGTITISFTTPQTWLALLWGSVDAGNSLSFSDGTVVTGVEIQSLLAGFVSNGFQGPGGSAYVIIDTGAPFTSVIATSDVVSFEFGGVAGSSSGFTVTPEPSSAWCLFGIGIGIVAMRRRINFSR